MGSFEVVEAVLGTLRWRLNGELAGAEAAWTVLRDDKGV